MVNERHKELSIEILENYFHDHRPGSHEGPVAADPDSDNSTVTRTWALLLVDSITRELQDAGTQKVQI